jgi:hypothetical protein
VSSVLREALQSALGPGQSYAANGFYGNAWRWTLALSKRELVLLQLHVSRYQTDKLFAGISTLLASDRLDRIILNMSFVVAPCDVAAWFRDETSPYTADLLKLYNALLATNSKEFADLQRLLAEFAKPVSAWSADARKVLHSVVEYLNAVTNAPWYRGLIDDQAWSLFAKSHPEGIAIGAAGNGIKMLDQGTVRTQRLDFPFVPAGWPGILSVSASANRDTILADYSNSGELLLRGEAIYQGTPIRGTSFAAARLAAQLGTYHYAMGAQPGCRLDYADLLHWPNTTFDNRALSQPTPGRCPASP